MSSDTPVSGSDRRRRWVPALFAPMRPLYNLYFAMVMLLVSILLPLVTSGAFVGTAFAAGALGVLLNVAMQLHSQDANER